MATRKGTRIAARLRGKERPYATWTDVFSGWKYRLLRSYQAVQSDHLARWHVYVEGEESEYGDTYVAELIPGLRPATDVVVDTTVWPDGPAGFWAWAQGRE